MNALKEGNKGPIIRQWQYFLIGQGFNPGIADGSFGNNTKLATIEFQKKYSLGADGVAGQQTLTKAMALGFQLVTDSMDLAPDGYNWPPKPAFSPITSNSARWQTFGKFSFTINNDADHTINIGGNWVNDNIIQVSLPELIGVKGFPKSGNIRFHKLAADNLKKAVKAWNDAGLISKILTWDGAFYPRMVRGSNTVISNHSFGTAFDINVAWNQLGAIPALAGEKGSVRELVSIANKFGFYWGGHYDGRKDGMHFEATII